MAQHVAELVAGRELDVLVAEKVMGWQRRLTELNAEQEVIVPPGWPDFAAQRWWGHNVRELVPHYSTSIEAAWYVFEMALFRTGHAEIVADMEDWGRGAFTGDGAEKVVTVLVGFPDEGIEKVVVTGPFPLAICRAALQAVQAASS